MSHYIPFFGVSVEHDYFGGGRCPHLDFVVTKSTKRLINNAGLLLRNTCNGIDVAYDDSRLDVLRQFAQDPDDGLCFEFKVYSRTPEFRGYTEPFSGSSGEVLYFSNESQGGEGEIKLHPHDYASSGDRLLVSSEKLKDALSRQDKVVPPVFFIRIMMEGAKSQFFDDQLNPISHQCCIKLKSRQTIWTYFVLGNAAKEGVYISDANEQIDFEYMGKATLADSRVAMTFRSKQSIPFTENYNYNFQLKEKRIGGDKVHIKRLPVARVGQVGKGVNTEQGSIVSEIYINS